MARLTEDIADDPPQTEQIDMSLFRRHIAACACHAGVPVAPAAAENAAHLLIPSGAPATMLGALLAVLEDGRAFSIGAAPACPVKAGHFTTQTSGSTGVARLICRSQASWRASFATNARLFGITPRDIYAVPGQLTHSIALYAAIEALNLGADLHLLAGMRPDRQVAEMRRVGATVLYATPTQLRQMFADTPALPALRLILCGGAKLDTQTRAVVRTACPNAEICEFFGAAETSFITLAYATTPEGSVGQPYPQVEVEIRGAEGEQLAADVVGEIWVNSPYLFDSYSTDDDPMTRRAGAFITVGEMGWRDAQGNLYLAGRKARMVTVRDQNVFCESVEAMLLSLPQVTGAAVVGVPDAKRGNRLVAFVVGDGLDPPALRRACLAQLSPVEIPSKFIVLDQIPQLPAGKPDLRALKEQVKSAP